MPAPLTPVTAPVTFSFNNGEIQLTTVIDPETKQHSVTCDLCIQVIKLGIRGSINRISQHRDSEKCKRKVFQVSKLDSKNRNLLGCSTKKQQSYQRFNHAQMYQFIVLYAPLLSLVILLLYGNIMPCII